MKLADRLPKLGTETAMKDGKAGYCSNHFVIPGMQRLRDFVAGKKA